AVIVKDPAEWRNLNLAGDPILIVGSRSGPKKLKAFYLELLDDTFGVLRAIGEGAVADLSKRTRLHWHPNATIEADEEYLSIQVDELPPAPAPRRTGIAGTSISGQAGSEKGTDPRL